MLRSLAAKDEGAPAPLLEPPKPSQRGKKASTACLACKQRKTKCNGGQPCEQCTFRGSQCVYNLAADQRRKVANQRNIRELSLRSQDIQRHCVLLGGLLATIRAGNEETVSDLIQAIRQPVTLPDLATYADELMAIWPAIYEAFLTIDFDLDDSPRQPSAEGLSATAEQPSPHATKDTFTEMETTSPTSDAQTDFHPPNSPEVPARDMIEYEERLRRGSRERRPSGSEADSSLQSPRASRPWELT